MQRALIALFLGCGGKPVPKPPQVPPAEALAKQLDDDLAKLAELTHRHVADCVTLAGALRPHVDQMRLHAGQVETMMTDPVKGRELKAALASYANTAPGRTDRIANDLGTAYLECPDPMTKGRLERAIADLPTFD